MSWARVCARRLQRHALSVPAPATRLAETVGVICGAHAQVMSAAELSIGLRVAGVDRARVQDALWTERTLVKTRGARGTVHLLPAADLPMWTGALSALPPVRSPFPADVQMTPEQTGQVVEAIAAALADAELTVDELTEAVVALTGPWAGDPVMEAFQAKWPRWRQAEQIATRQGAMCFGANRGRQVTYTSPARWLPGFTPLPARPALAALVERYLFAYGPATPAHFGRWLGVPTRWATELFDSLELIQVDGGWVATDDQVFPDIRPQGVRLLPYFDAYPVGCHPRELVYPDRAAERALTRGQAGNVPVLLVDGVVAGVWHQRRSGRRIEVTVETFEPLKPARRRALDEQLDRVGEILDGSVSLTLGEVTAGPHA